MDDYYDDDDFDLLVWIHDQDSDHPIDEWDMDDYETEDYEL